MNAIRMSRPRITAVAATAAMTTLALIGLTAHNGASADAGRTLRLTNAIDSIVFVGGPPPAQAPGGTFFVYSHVVSGGEGTTSASCVLVSTFGAGVRQCEVDMVLADGIVTTRGLTDLANTEVTLVVTGGTGRYASARGTGTLTPTRTGSEVELTLR
jgi:hypothetical protein